MNLTTILTLILGAGGATFIGALFNGLRDIRRGSRQRTKDLMEDLAKAADEQERRADRERSRAEKAEEQRDLWHTAAARYAMQLISHGHEPIPPFAERWPGEESK